MALVTNRLNEVLVFGEEPTRITSNDGTIEVTKQVGSEVYDLSVGETLEGYATKEEVEGKQDTLVSGTNIKTINGETLLGEGNIVIQGGSGGEVKHDNTLIGKGTNESQLGVNTEIIAQKSDIPDSYTKSESDEKYALKDDVPTDVYTKEECDEKFQPIGNYANVGDSYTKQESDNKYQEKGDYQPAGDYVESSTLNNYYTKTEIQNTYAEKSEVPDSYTKTESDEKYQVKGDYALESELSGKQDALTTEQLYNINNAVTSLDGYATESWVESKGYLTEHQDISNLATKDEVNAKQDTLVSGTNIKTINGETLLGEGDIEITSVAQVEHDETLTGKGTEEEPLSVDVDNLGIEFPTETIGFIADNPLKFYEDSDGRVHISYEGATPSTLVTDSTLVGVGSEESPLGVDTTTIALKSEIPDVSGKQDTLVSGTNIKTINGESILGEGNIVITSTDSYTKEESDAKYALKDEVPTDVYTKEEANEKFAEKSEIIDSYTKTESDGKYQEKGNYATTDDLSSKQDTLVSGTNIKTINGNSILGEGNIEIQGGSGLSEVAHDDTLEGTGVVGDELSVVSIPLIAGTNITFEDVENGIKINATTTGGDTYTKEEVNALVGAKQDTLVSGTNIKTINNQSILGSGNISINSTTATNTQVDELFNS